MSSIRNTVIIGSGPAGLTAAIYTSRANLKPLMIEGYQAGGQLMTTTDVENYPGFPEGVMGPDLMGKFRDQAKRFGTEFVTKDVTKVDFSSRPFKVWIGQDLVQAHSVIVSTGAQAKLLGLPNEKTLMGKGVSTCATCDGAFFKNVPVAVAGGGDSAMEESNFLTRFASKVFLIHRRQEFKASKIMLERARKNPKIEFILDTIVEDCIGGPKGLEKLKLKNSKTGKVSELPVEGFFVAIGHTPNTQLFKGALTLDEKGYIKTHQGSRTNIEGVFACGDVQDSIYRQAITASGSGCQAAIDAERFLESVEAH